MSQPDAPMQKTIVIAGGGTAGWIAAALLSVHMPRERIRVRLVESEEIGAIGVGESTIPPFLGLIRNLGINEQDFIARTQASFKLGIRFKDWRVKGESYFHPFGHIGAPIESNDFYQAWLKAKLEGHDSRLQDFAPAAVMADHGRFMLPQKAPRTPVAPANYALHVDAKRVAQYLRRHAEAHGAERTEGLISGVNLREDGHIRSLTLKSGEEVAGDVFIDCTGFRALLIGQALGVGYEDWTRELPCDRAVVVQSANVRDPAPCTLAEAQDAGWRWRIPLQHRSGNGHVYASRYMSDADAEKTLLAGVEGELLTQPTTLRFTTGVRDRIWEKNCLALGLASGFIEPLESTAIHLVYRTLDFFFRFFPEYGIDTASQAEFNRRIRADYVEIKDFVVLHYAATQRDDTEFWRHCKSQPLSEALQTRIAAFRANGVLAERGPEELFKAPSWQSVLEGMGVRPRHCSLLTQRLDGARLHRLLDEGRAGLSDYVRGLPTHGEFLRQFCPAEAPV